MKGQKSIIRTLTNRSFKANKTRNLIAVFAIVLTTVMFTSLFVLSQSMVENMRNMNFQQAGYNSHLSSSTMTDADMEKIVSHEAVRDYGKSTIIGVAENKELTGRQVEIRYADENYANKNIDLCVYIIRCWLVLFRKLRFRCLGLFCFRVWDYVVCYD